MLWKCTSLQLMPIFKEWFSDSFKRKREKMLKVRRLRKWKDRKKEKKHTNSITRIQAHTSSPAVSFARLKLHHAAKKVRSLGVPGWRGAWAVLELTLIQFILTCGFTYHVNESLTISQKCKKLTAGKQQDSQQIGSSSKSANVEIVDGPNVISSGAMGLP